MHYTTTYIYVHLRVVIFSESKKIHILMVFTCFKKLLKMQHVQKHSNKTKYYLKRSKLVHLITVPLDTYITIRVNALCTNHNTEWSHLQAHMYTFFMDELSINKKHAPYNNFIKHHIKASPAGVTYVLYYRDGLAS